MDLSHHHHHTANTPLYWALWLTYFTIGKILGFIAWLSEIIPHEDFLPPHEVHYLPEWGELIPAAITAVACAVCSLITTKLLSMLWRYIIWPGIKRLWSKLFTKTKKS